MNKEPLREKKIERTRERYPYLIVLVGLLLTSFEITEDWFGKLRIPLEIIIGVALILLVFYFVRRERRARLKAEHAADETRRSADALRESEERYRAFVASISEAVWRFEMAEPVSIASSVDEQIERFYRDGYLAECNDQMARMYGLDRAEQLAGTRLVELLPREREENVEYLRAFIRSGYKLSGVETQEQSVGGETRRFTNNLIGVIEDGQIRRAWGTQADVTERSRMESALRHAEAHFRTVVESLGEALLITDFEDRVISINSRVTEMTGYTLEEMKGRPGYELLLPPEHWPSIQQRTAGRMHGVSESYEVQLKKKDGTLFWVEVRATPYRDGTGQPVGTIGSMTDITVRRRMQEALKRSEEHYRLIFERNPQPVWVYDTKTLRFLDVNDAAVSHYGYTREEFLSMTIRDIRPEEEIPALLKDLANSANGLPGASSWRHRRKDGAVIDVEVTANNFDFDGQPARLVLVKDVTARLRAERERYIISEIVQGVSATSSLEDSLALIHRSISKILYAENCYVALLDEETGMLNTKFFVDKYDEWPAPYYLDHGRTAYVYRTGRPARLTEEDAQALAEAGELKQLGTPTACWMGVPLRTATGIVGVLVVQHYEDECAYSDRDLDFLEAAGAQAALAIERRRAEDALRRSEEHFRALIENGNDIISLLDENGTILYESPSLERVTGYKPEELLGKNAFEFIHHEDASRVLQMFWRYLGKNQTTVPVEYRFRHKDGSWCMLESIGKSYADEKGGLVGIINSRDVTERRRVEEALKKSEERFQLAARATNDAIWDWDLLTGELWQNEGFGAMFGYTPGELEPSFEAWRALVHPDDAERVEQILQMVVDEGLQNWSQEYRFRRGDGSYAIVIDRGYAARDAEGRPVRMIGSMMDITGRKQAEEALAVANRRAITQYEALLEHVASLEQTLSKARDEATVFRAIREFAQASVPMEGFLICRYDAERNVRVPVYCWAEGGQIDVSGYAPLPLTETGPSSKAVRTGQVVLVNEAYSRTLTTPVAVNLHDGRVPQASLIVPMVMTGRVVGTVEVQSFSRNIYREEHLPPMRMAANLTAVALENLGVEAELRRARDAALESSRMKSQFLANTSHEIRTPMNGVMGMTELLLDTPLAPDQRKFAETILQSADSLMIIINDILDFSKMEAGKLAFVKEDFDLVETVESVAELLAARAHAKGLEVVASIADDVPVRLRGDAGRLRQVLTNVIGNAVKFTASGDVLVAVVCEKNEPDYSILRFEISDTGIGIKDEAKRHLFQPFVQADGSTTRRYGGTGLGLAISKQLVEMMGGEIGVESEEGRGSTFWFNVRFEKQSAGDAPHAFGRNLSGLHLLVIDDNATNRKMIVERTAARGVLCDEAATGADGLRMMREALDNARPYDLALIELQMPDMDGRDLVRAIRQDPALARMRLALMPSFSYQGCQELTRETGIDDCLVKPIRRAQLFSCLEALICEEQMFVDEDSSIAALSEGSLGKQTPDGHDGARLPRVLVAEDNPVNQKVVLSQLRKLGYEAQAVENGRQALESLAQSVYDVVLMDCQMPEMDGYEATTELRRLEATTGLQTRTPIVAMTAHAMQGEREKCLAAGMDDYISKPMTLDDLREVLERQGAWHPKTSETRGETIDARAAVLAQPVLDRSALAALSELCETGGENFTVKVVELFFHEASERLRGLREALADGDAHRAGREAHRLRSACSNTGARRMAALCTELERLEKQNMMENFGALFTALEDAFEETRRLLESQLQENVV